jgi:hypothetical protein
MTDKVYSVFLLAMILGLSFLVLLVIGFCIREIFRKKHVPKPPEFIRVISPKPFIRRVATKDELRHTFAIRGDMAYVNDENCTYFYGGESWLKVEQKYHGNERKETGDNV